MHQQLGKESKQEVLVQTHREPEVGPVVTELETLKSIPLEVHLSIEVLFVENFHGDLALAPVGNTVMFTVEIQVVFDGTASVLGLFGFARGDGRRNSPESHQNRDSSEDAEENAGVETSTKLTGQVPRNENDQREEQDIGEAIAAGGVCRNGSIFNRRVL